MAKLVQTNCTPGGCLYHCTTARSLRKDRHTSVSASMKTHLLNCVRRQQCSLVNVTLRSGRPSSCRLMASRLSSTSTSTTWSKTRPSWFLHNTQEHVTTGMYFILFIYLHFNICIRFYWHWSIAYKKKSMYH